MFNKFESFLRNKVVKQNPSMEIADTQPQFMATLPLRELYAMYNYIPEEEAETEMVDIDAKWPEDINLQIDRAVRKLLQNIGIVGGNEVIEINNDLSMRLKIYDAYGERNIRINLIDKRAVKIISSVECNTFENIHLPNSKAEHWNLGHRVVAERYRGRGIGTNMMSSVEQVVQSVADLDQRTQIIFLKASQLGVLNTALKRRYFPVSAQDKVNLQAVYAGNAENFFVTTIHGEGNGGVKRPGVVYSFDVLEELALERGLGQLSAEQIRSMGVNPIFQGNTNQYLNYAINIKLQKEKKPRPIQ